MYFLTLNKNKQNIFNFNEEKIKGKISNKKNKL